MAATAKSTRRRTAEALVEAFNRMDIDRIISYRSEDCMRHILPSTLGHAATDNAQYRASLEKLKAIFYNFDIQVHDFLEDAGAGRVCMWLKARADTMAGEYVNEYMWTLDFDDAGTKITKATEFVDSVVNRDFWPKLQQAMNAFRDSQQSVQTHRE